MDSTCSRNVLQTYVDVLNAVEKTKQWDSSSLLAAFQWASALGALTAGQPITTEGPDSLLAHTRCWKDLPPTIRAALPQILHRPQANMLLWFLHTRSGDAEWIQKVLAAYTTACVLTAESKNEQKRLEQEATGVLAQLGAQHVCVGLLEQDLPVTAHALISALELYHDSLECIAKALALHYFTGPMARAFAGVGLMMQRRINAYKDPEELSTLLPDPTGIDEVTVLAMGIVEPNLPILLQDLKFPSWERPSKQVMLMMTDLYDMTMMQALVSALEAKPSLVVDLPPSLMAVACRTALAVVKAYAGALEKVLADGRCSEAQAKDILKHFWIKPDHVTDYMKSTFSNLLK